ncbi:hypothetical protein SARC_10823 [Sphaeroforma arctica JP610]|uniref:Inhibitor of growth protein n=1 Tax=Sphaeroforma arctica JP610 TaxID=667725 RepID=A0A0L0FJP6_9EUKA|nr:hypothetical protein SARC_10823 [Sphaeroforma arctica JP610]KNC76686.1 hypothetical protein SARC_10823 [Sphaeroforma arctica JP610]|eukprot:XP_014150588.1 hypothetical protein SARC_10823 [Sphaeroforma arctica JP610]
MKSSEKETYLDKYLAHISDLLPTLSLKMANVDEVTRQVDEMLESITVPHEKLYESLCDLNTVERKRKVDEIQETFRKANQLCDKKIEITQGAYALIDKHINKLDTDVKRLDKRLHSQTNGTPQKKNKYGRNKKRSRKNGAARADMVIAAEALPKIDIEMDMPVDPNEPTYCTCQQVAYGEMVACENSTCQTEWFHFGCVKLTQKPRGKWYCQKCATANAQ